MNLEQCMQAFGLMPTSVISDEKYHRCPGGGQTEGAKGTNGWYISSIIDGHQFATYGDWKTGEKETWKDERICQLDPQQQANFRRKQEEQSALAEAERQKTQGYAAKRAQQIWDASTPVGKDSHPYLSRKQVQSHGLRIDSHGNLLVPLFDQDSNLINLQLIAPEKDPGTGREKNFLRGSKKEGGRCIIGKLEEAKTVLLCEGYATAASLYEATGCPVVACFDSGNLPVVAQQMREALPKDTATDFPPVMVICGDDDILTAQKYPYKNPGRTAA